MDYDHVNRYKSMLSFGLPKDIIDKAISFCDSYNDYLRSNSTCCHLGGGWFILYDYPLAEAWIRTCSWNLRAALCSDTSYMLVEIHDPAGAVEMKLRWHNAR